MANQGIDSIFWPVLRTRLISPINRYILFASYLVRSIVYRIFLVSFPGQLIELTHTTDQIQDYICSPSFLSRPSIFRVVLRRSSTPPFSHDAFARKQRAA